MTLPSGNVTPHGMSVASRDGNGVLSAGLVEDRVAGRQRRLCMPARQIAEDSGGAGGPLAEHTAELRFMTAERIAALFIAAAPHVPAYEAVGAAHIVSGAAEQLARWWYRNPDISLETVVDGVMTVIWPGLQLRLNDATS